MYFYRKSFFLKFDVTQLFQNYKTEYIFPSLAFSRLLKKGKVNNFSYIS